MRKFDKSIRTGINLSSARRDTATGPMVFTATPAPYDCVLVYPESRDFRPRAEVTDSESLRSWQGLPIVVEHQDVTMATLDRIVGYVRSARDGQRGWIEADLVITDADTVTRILSGELGALSGGYQVDSQVGRGSHNGVEFTETQRRIRMAHLALGPATETWARAGAEARIR